MTCSSEAGRIVGPFAWEVGRSVAGGRGSSLAVGRGRGTGLVLAWGLWGLA